MRTFLFWLNYIKKSWRGLEETLGQKKNVKGELFAQTPPFNRPWRK
jgi:hypothetical protein